MTVYELIQDLVSYNADATIELIFTTKDGEEKEADSITVYGRGRRVFIECTE